MEEMSYAEYEWSYVIFGKELEDNNVASGGCKAIGGVCETSISSNLDVDCSLEVLNVKTRMFMEWRGNVAYRRGQGGWRNKCNNRCEEHVVEAWGYSRMS